MERVVLVIAQLFFQLTVYLMLKQRNTLLHRMQKWRLMTEQVKSVRIKHRWEQVDAEAAVMNLLSAVWLLVKEEWSKSVAKVFDTVLALVATIGFVVVGLGIDTADKTSCEKGAVQIKGYYVIL